MGKSAIPAAVSAPAAPIVSLPVPGEDCDLLELLAGVPDGRTGQGGNHPVAAVLELAATAVVAGMKGYKAISGWVAEESQVRTRSGPRAMAALRNLAIGALRMAGRTDITEATRWVARASP